MTCFLCSSEDHVFCGFCNHCHDHAAFNPPEDDPEDMPVSECCGATGRSYDDDGGVDYNEAELLDYLEGLDEEDDKDV